MGTQMSCSNRLVIACVNTLFREGLSKILDNDESIKIVAETSNLIELIQYCEEGIFDILLLDLELEGLNLSKILELVKNDGKVILIIPDKLDDDELTNAILSGVRGYISKDANSSQLIKAIHAVEEGQLWIERKMMNKALDGFLISQSNRRKRRNSSIYSLSKTELKIVRMVLDGQSNKEIARHIYLSEKTVKFHLYKIFKKLSVKSRSELILYGYRKRLVG